MMELVVDEPEAFTVANECEEAARWLLDNPQGNDFAWAALWLNRSAALLRKQHNLINDHKAKD